MGGWEDEKKKPMTIKKQIIWSLIIGIALFFVIYFVQIQRQKDDYNRQVAQCFETYHSEGCRTLTSVPPSFAKGWPFRTDLGLGSNFSHSQSFGVVLVEDSLFWALIIFLVQFSIGWVRRKYVPIHF
jgi:hypothetical protein